ncbi:Copper transport protein [Lachnellula hyalina]|uniref:Copper transport protein n=1 Tax=Lachnellula hyalina TaxID=1316788 RepID=A0A8H8TWG6_9HELO|nr:Copper transport protein [Lachnellula hyalina]TVY23275.1 Copper transport protein [Lachnellula hyalina]
MDHAHMDHSGMDHSGMDHGGHAMPAMCSMNMLFTWDTNNLCLIFRWWHVQTTPGLILSLLAVVALTAAYEFLRSLSRRYEAFAAEKAEESPNESVAERTPLVWSGRNQVEVSQRAHIIKAALYAIQNFYAFMLMLLFMTYNGWVMLSVAVGAFIGFLLFGNNTSSTKDGACH